MSDQSGRLPRLLVSGAVALLLGLAGWRIVSIALADLYRPDDPDLALTWLPGDANALVSLAKAASEGTSSPIDARAAEGFAAAALRSTPLASEAVRILGLLAADEGEHARAAALVPTAAERWLYDAEAQIWSARHFLREGDLPAALRHLDGVLRAHPVLTEPIFPALVSLTIDPTTKESVTDLLATSPPWRARFLEQLAVQAPDPAAPLEILAALKDRDSPPTVEELRGALDRLIREQQFDAAYLGWTRFLPAERLTELGNVYNGAFEAPVTGLPFDWSFGTVRGATIDVRSPPDRADTRALRVEFNGSRIPFRHVKQHLLLPPGSYEFTIQARADGLRNERGLRWQISCAVDQSLIGATQTISGTTGWIESHAAFEVPAEGCEAQILRLELAYRTALEQEAAGLAWFDNAMITRSN